MMPYPRTISIKKATTDDKEYIVRNFKFVLKAVVRLRFMF